MAQLLLRLRVLRSLFGLMLIASTWRLWFPDGDAAAFPVIPFSGWLTGVPLFLDHALSAALLTALSMDLVAAALRMRSPELPSELRWLRRAWVGIAAAGIALVLLDQQRLQPWMYHLILLTPVLALEPNQSLTTPHGRKWFEWSPVELLLVLTASIYCWSAVSKLDVSFAREHGTVFVDAMMQAVGLSTRFWTPATKNLAAIALPTVELMIGFGLLMPRTRRLALLLSVGMHAALILAVGPLGMNQRPGVILWNLMFIAQNIVVVRSLKRLAAAEPQSHGSAGDGDVAVDSAERRTLQAVVTVVTLLACAAPSMRMLNCFDNWPSWAVYTASNRRVSIRVLSAESLKLPWKIRTHLQKSIYGGRGWLRIDQWALAEFDAPIYPQDRLHVAVALALARRYALGLRVVVTEEADRFSGERHEWSVEGRAEIEQVAAEFWCNTTERNR